MRNSSEEEEDDGVPILVSGAPPNLPHGPVVVHAEEALIVCLVMILWVAAIALFFNRWGKIRMLEPYQPKFNQEHRPSCTIPEVSCLHQAHRSSMSKYTGGLNALGNVEIGSAFPPSVPPYRSLLRPRQNSVFVGSTTAIPAPARKTKSAMDLHTIVFSEPSPSRSLAPLPPPSQRRMSSLGLSFAAEHARRPSSAQPRRPSVSPTYLSCHCEDRRPSTSHDHLSYRRPSFSSVLAQVTAERRPSSSMLRITPV